MMRRHLANPEYEVAYHDLIKLVSKHADKVSVYEILAIAANLVGKIIALQDQRVVTREMAMELVAKNIEEGNNQIIEGLLQTKGTA